MSVSKPDRSVISFFLVMVLVLAVIAPSAQAAETVASGTCGYNLSWTLDKDGVLKISGSGEMENYPASGGPWPKNDVRTVIFPDGLTTIGYFAFRDCDNLTSVSIPGSVKTIGDYSFMNCVGLTDLTISNGVNVICSNAFWNCPKLESVSIPGSVTTIDDEAFFNCDGLSSVTFSEGLESIGSGAFSGCHSLKTAYLPDSLECIGNNAFFYCDQLTEIRLPKGLSEIGAGAFSLCPGLGDPNGFFIWKDTLLSYYGANESVTIPDHVTRIGGCCFAYCHGSLKSVSIPNNTTSIGDAAFSGCYALSGVHIPASVTSIGNQAFQGCSGLTSLTLPTNVTEIGIGAFEACTGLKSITIPSGITKIESNTFYGCSDLSSITIPASVTTIDSYAFLECDSLKDVYFGGDETGWALVYIEDYNDSLEGVTVHFAASGMFFTDVSKSAWYYKDVAAAFKSGLINGKTAETFAPNDNLTYAEAVKLAACMHQLYTTGSVQLSNGTPWYQSYADYAKANGIIIKDYAWNEYATRAGYMEIFANALPEEAMEQMNWISHGSIPDVPETHPQADAIYQLYRVGILEGSTDVFNGTLREHLCKPADPITRAEVAAILTRMMNPDKRISFELD